MIQDKRIARFLLVVLPVLISCHSTSVNAENTTLQRVFADTFDKASDDWESTRGDWHVAEGKYRVLHQGTHNAIAYPRLVPFTKTQSVRATLALRKRVGNSGWSFAGITILNDSANLWLLALTESPRGERYVDFLESYRGAWQAQNQRRTKLVFTPRKDFHSRWAPGEKYDLRLDMTEEGIEATVVLLASGKTIAAGRYDFGQTNAVRMGVLGLIVRGVEAEFDDVSIAVARPLESPPATAAKIERGAKGRVAILNDDLPGTDPGTAPHLAAALRSSGLGVTFLSAASVADSSLLTRRNFDLYIIPNARVYPGDALGALEQYLRSKGHLMVLGGPPFSRPKWSYEGKWLDKKALRQLVMQHPAERVVLDFDNANDLADWQRATNAPDTPASIELAPGGPDRRGKCMRVSMQDLTGWCTYTSPEITGLFPPGHELFCFWAKGDAKTPQISIEIDEADGSRWIGVAPLKTTWQKVALSPGDFPYWRDSPTKNSRGGLGDRLNPQAAVRIVFGLASSHTQKVGRGPHTFWIDQIGSARNPVAEILNYPGRLERPIATLSPSYKLYPLRNIAEVRSAPGQVILKGDTKLPVPSSALSAIARPRGQGFGNRCKWRWMPLIEALDSHGQRTGTIAWMLQAHTLPSAGAIVAAFGINDPALLKTNAWTSAIIRAASRMVRGVFFREAGARHFAYWPGEETELGAEVVNVSQTVARLAVRITVRHAGRGQILFKDETPVQLQPSRSAKVRFQWRPPRAPGECCGVLVELLEGGEVIDVIEHQMKILEEQKPAADQFVTVRGSDFFLQGRKWVPVGVNFWPLYVSGQEPRDYGLGWLSPGFYIPDEVERDLKRMAALGINMVIIQLGRQEGIRNLLDFLGRCDRHGIKVFGFLRQASPLAFDEAGARRFIAEARLQNNSALFAYDTIWEPGNWMFRKDMRPKWDRDWEKWIVDRYGNVANAESDWGIPPPRANGKITSPSDSQMKTEGKWRILVAAYRRFMDDFASRKWNRARRRLKKIDPNHLVSFRQGNTLPHDFTFTATPKHIDFICPEGYSIPPGKDGANAACFSTRYVHFTTRGKPILWAEFGRSVWDHNRMTQDPAAIDRQCRYHEIFYRMVLDAGANGTAPWWWPGGYRVNERSDFGICNPDGTPRPSALLIRKYAPEMKAARNSPEPDTWLTIDRDAHPGGYWHIVFNEGRDAWRKARSEGKHLGVRTAGTGTTSADCPLVAVGNRPYNGKNPPKYLDAEFNWLQVQNAAGAWIHVTDGSRIEVKMNATVRARASLGNIQEAEWLAPANAQGGKGAVYLSSATKSDVNTKVPIRKNTPYLADADLGEFTLCSGVSKECVIVLQMQAEARAWFGEKREFTLVPK